MALVVHKPQLPVGKWEVGGSQTHEPMAEVVAIVWRQAAGSVARIRKWPQAKLVAWLNSRKVVATVARLATTNWPVF